MFLNIRSSIAIACTIALCGLAVSSCSGDKSLRGKPVNMNGGQNRSSDYSWFGTLTSSGSQFIDIPPAPDSSGAIVLPLVMDIGKIAFATRDGSINVSLSDDTLWTCRLPLGCNVVAGMCADKDQNLYAMASNGTLLSYSDKGALRWSYVFNRVHDSDIVLFSDLLAVADGVIVASTDGWAAKVSAGGKEVWRKRFTGSVMRLFPADEDGNVFIPLTFDTFGATDSLYCIAGDGKVKWSAALVNTRIIRPPVLDSKNIYLPVVQGEGDNKKPKLIAIGRNGKQAWSADLPYSPRFISAGEEDEVIVVCYDMAYGKPYSLMICFDGKGKKLWENAMDLTILTPVMIGEDSYAVVAARENTAAVFYYKREENVVLFRDYQLPDDPAVNLTPVVLPGPVLAFAGSDKYLIFRIDKSQLEKLFPW